MPEKNTIDINDPMLQQEMVEANPEADFFEPPPPPPDDREYQVRLILGERGIQVKRQYRKGVDEGAPSGPLYLNVHIEERIVDPDQPWDNRTLNENATSIVMQSTGTSALHTILRACGCPALGRMSLMELKDHTLNALAGEPLAVISGRWEAQVEDSDPKTGEKVYRTICKGMKHFPMIDPRDPSLGYSNIAVDKRTGEEARAQFRVQRYRLP